MCSVMPDLLELPDSTFKKLLFYDGTLIALAFLFLRFTTTYIREVPSYDAA